MMRFPTAAEDKEYRDFLDSPMGRFQAAYEAREYAEKATIDIIAKAGLRARQERHPAEIAYEVAVERGEMDLAKEVSKNWRELAIIVDKAG